jgi:hypothetical protein
LSWFAPNNAIELAPVESGRGFFVPKNQITELGPIAHARNLPVDQITASGPKTRASIYQITALVSFAHARVREHRSASAGQVIVMCQASFLTFSRIHDMT